MTTRTERRGDPIVVGVTGHRDLRPEDEPRLRAQVRARLQRLLEVCPHSPFVMLNCAAAGGDTLCAEEALALGMELVCPLPMEAEVYRKNYAGAELAAFERLLASASTVFPAPFAEPVPEPVTANYRYRQADIYVASRCHVLLALWDGKPGKPGGCGAAETVEFLLRGDYRAAKDGAVLHIPTPRASDPGRETDTAVRLLENTEGALWETLRGIDERNARVGAGPGSLSGGAGGAAT